MFFSIRISMAILIEIVDAITICTGDRLFAGVNSTMPIQFATSYELLLTSMTSARLFPGMNSTMRFQMRTLFELLVTVRTGESEFYDAPNCLAV